MAKNNSIPYKTLTSKEVIKILDGALHSSDPLVKIRDEALRIILVEDLVSVLCTHFGGVPSDVVPAEEMAGTIYTVIEPDGNVPRDGGVYRRYDEESNDAFIEAAKEKARR